jgi:PLD-like domain
VKPARHVVRSIVRSWHLDVEWLEDEWERLTGCLLRLSEANGGRVLLDVPLGQAAFDSHFRDTCEAVIGRDMRHRARRLGAAPVTPYEMVDATGPSPALPFLQPRRPVARIDINKATQRTLMRRAGLTDDEARAILVARKIAGRFADLSPVEQAVDKTTWSRLRHLVHAGCEEPAWRDLSHAQRVFVRFPTLRNYLRLIDLASPHPVTQSARKAAVFTALEEILAGIQPTPGFSPRRVTAASEIVRARKVRAVVHSAERQSARDLSGVALLDGSQYLRFLKMALAQATESIRVVMFFMAHRPDGKHPLTPILEELHAAKQRQVDVRVILDKDGPTDVFNSRRINRAAFRFLVDHDIPVVFSTANKVIHSKVVLIDRRHVLLGSHNWTLGSMFHYDEKSVYLESPQIGVRLERQFQRLWRNPEDHAAFRDQLLATGDEADPALRQAGVYSAEDLLRSTDSPERLQKLGRDSGLPPDRVEALRREVILKDLEVRVDHIARSFPARIEALNRSVRTVPGRCRALAVIPGASRDCHTLFTLTDEQGERRRLPFRLPPGTRATVRAGIANRTGQVQEYRLSIRLGTEPAAAHCFRLAPGEEERKEISFNAPEDGRKRVVRLALQEGDAALRRMASLYLVVTGDAQAAAGRARPRTCSFPSV